MIHPTVLPTVFNTTENLEDEILVSNDSPATVGAVILSLVFLLGVPGNLFIVWSILARTRRHNVTTFLIMNLAIADGCLMALTIFFMVYLVKQSWVFGNVMCKVLFYLCNTNMYASVFLITLMSVHRCAVLLPTKVSLLASTRIVKWVVVCMWLLVLIISIPSLVFRNIRKVHDAQHRDRLVCVPNHTLPREVRFQYSFETTVGFILPYAIIITSYVTLRQLRKTTFSKMVRIEKLILAIVVTSGIFWLPYHVVNMIQVAAEWYDKGSPTRKNLDHIGQSSRAVTSALAFISSCANPVLYTFAGKSYIRQNGFGFMARLFEETSLDQTTKSQTTDSDVGLNNVVTTNNTEARLIQKGTNTGS